jgi:drug/metabolite transporter (DMT)-like permease
VTTAVLSAEAGHARTSRRNRSLLLVALCTLLNAAAQMLIKSGANSLPQLSGFVPNALAMASNLYLVAGYSLYGLFTIVLVLALRDGELSLLYPVIALAYVWVAILSVIIFHERMNWLRALGILTIVFGVAVIGREQRS